MDSAGGKDLEAAKVLSHAAFHSQAVWLAAQGVEKAHKAILAALGLRSEDKHFKRLGHGTGEIADLLPVAVHEPIDPQIALMVASLESRALASRYPSPSKLAGGTPALVVAVVASEESLGALGPELSLVLEGRSAGGSAELDGVERPVSQKGGSLVP